MIACSSFLPVAQAESRNFSDVPEGHWALDPVCTMAGVGVLLGYPDGTFRGSDLVTRNQIAAVIDRTVESSPSSAGLDDAGLRAYGSTLMQEAETLRNYDQRTNALETELKGLDKNLSELRANGATSGYGTPGSRISFSGDLRFRFQLRTNDIDTIDTNDWSNQARIGFNLDAVLDDGVKAHIRFMRDEVPLESVSNANRAKPVMDEAYIQIKDFQGWGDVTLGRHWMTLGKNLVLADKMDGITFSTKMDKVDFSFMAFSTRDRNSAINDRHYGNDSGTRRYYLFTDASGFANGAGAANLATGAGLIGGTAVGAAPLAGTDAMTLYTSPYSYSNPSTWYTGSSTGSWTYNDHAGLALTGGYDDNGDGKGDSLAPVRVPTTASTGVRGAFVPYSYIAPTATLDATGTDGQGQAVGTSSLTRDWAIDSASGLDSWAMKVGTKFGSHKVSAYYLKRKFDRYDPYTMLGDPWAAMCDTNNDGVVDVAVDGTDLSPAASPSYAGISLDGSVVKNLDYFFDYVSFDPDINNIGVNPLTGDAINSAGQWKGNNLSSGQAWVLGLDWSITSDLTLLVQYGVGDEEFVPASIYESKRLNSMMGRLNSPDPWNGSTFNSTEGMMSLTGVRDMIISLQAKLDKKTSAFVTLEASRDRDSSPERLVSGDPLVTGHPKQDFNLVTVEVKHKYKPNVLLRLQYEDFRYQDASVAQATSVGTLENTTADDSNWGDWNRVRFDVEVKF